MSPSDAVSRLFDVAGKHVVITGGTRGIGRMIATGFAAAGARVVISSRDAEAAAQAQDELRTVGAVTALVGDVSSPANARALAAAATDVLGTLDVLVNNAGVTWGAPLDSFPESGWDKVMHTNVEGLFHFTTAALPALRAAVETTGDASIINIGSADGINVPTMESYSYGASKAAVHHLTRHLAKRLAPERIRVNAIAPGLFESKMTKFVVQDATAKQAIDATIPLGRFGTADEIAGMSIFLGSSAGRYVTGAVIPVDGGLVGCGPAAPVAVTDGKLAPAARS
ncbi:3-oxoacyl-ACP reductase [Mycolicibacterium peregrinum]|uniref:3-oxoacyl-ACP reductase n=1 Tax=Mycolicibacterium peregrinum TaxID=43304 RepID=A0A1A0QYD1_MYCPR|nr:glucose 1-dehydrogenase [Mycolicibacterium peregrinum]OBB27171.1 3-oxoacyl-ACP reductase [Mycolicibacterium peregrinum]